MPRRQAPGRPDGTRRSRSPPRDGVRLVLLYYCLLARTGAAPVPLIVSLSKDAPPLGAGSEIRHPLPGDVCLCAPFGWLAWPSLATPSPPGAGIRPLGRARISSGARSRLPPLRVGAAARGAYARAPLFPTCPLLFSSPFHASFLRRACTAPVSFLPRFCIFCAGSPRERRFRARFARAPAPEPVQICITPGRPSRTRRARPAGSPPCR